MGDKKTAFESATSVRYLHLLMQLEEARLKAGGTLPEETESRFVEQLDALWRKLERTEQFMVEEELSRRIASAWRRGQVIELPPWTRDDPGAWQPRWLVWVLVIACTSLGFALGAVV